MAGDAELIEEYKQIHAKSDWGGTSVKNLHHIEPHIRRLQPRSIIDYGCGKSPLLDLLESPNLSKRTRYDPAIDTYSVLDRGPHDLLINVDVLEHVPEESLHEILSEMASISNDVLIIVDTQPAKLILEDGRNAHVTLHDHNWWHKRLEKYFGPLVPIRVRRSGRAAFRSWPLSTTERILMPLQNVIARIKGLVIKQAVPSNGGGV